MITPLQVTSAYTLLHSPLRLTDYVQVASERGYRALALTDVDVLYGAVEFYQLCQAAGIKPIIGCAFNLPGFLLSDRQFPVLVYARNTAGYQQLMHLSSLRMQQADAHQLMTYLSERATDIAVVLPSVENEVISLLQQARYDDATHVIHQWQETLDNRRFYLSVTTQYVGRQVREAVYHCAQTTETPCLTLHDVRYLDTGDHLSLLLLEAIHDNRPIGLQDSDHSGEYYLPTQQQLMASWQEVLPADVIAETERFIDDITLEVPLHQRLLPKFPVPAQYDAATYLRERCEEGLAARGHAEDAAYRERLADELRVIHDMGFDDYFLIVWDVMRYAHEQGMMVGPGRGSAAGSLVSYCLQITQVDPIRYDLLFERFLNHERYSMPDIDLDFPDNQRGKILQYVALKYGHNHVAQIATFGTFGAKMAIRDVARMMNFSAVELKQLARAIDQRQMASLDDVYANVPAFKRLIDSSPRFTLLYETSRRIEGLPRHVSTHAAGVVISDRPLSQLVPVQQLGDGLLLTQMTMKAVETIGLLKMDFLGLKNLTILAKALSIVTNVMRQPIDIWQIPLDDEKTLQVFQKAQTNGIFQFESAGIRQVLRRLIPQSLEDIAAVNALYRPGPMAQIDHFIQRKHGREPITYPHDSLKDILEKTYGIMVYQEQVMQVASRMAGFSLGQADILRRAMGKKDQVLLNEQQAKFLDGAEQLGYTRAVAKQVFDYIEKFVNYGFNRSHAFAYSLLAYQLAYLKTHYPVAFYIGLLDNTPMKHDNFRKYLQEAKRSGLALVGPDVQTSPYHFAIVGQNNLQFGLSQIHGVPRDCVRHIINERPYDSLPHFLQKLDARWLKPEIITRLIQSGALDSFKHTRAALIRDVEPLIKNALYQQQTQLSLDGLGRFFVHQIAPCEEYSADELAAQEIETLGFPLAGTALDKYQPWYEQSELLPISDLPEQGKVAILAQVTHIRQIMTKKQQPMAFLTVQDTTGELSIVVFPDVYQQHFKRLKDNHTIVLTGHLEDGRDGTKQLIVGHIETPQQFRDRSNVRRQTIYIKVELSEAVVTWLTRFAAAHRGAARVSIYDALTKQYQQLSHIDKLASTPDVLDALAEQFGQENVVLRTRDTMADIASE